MGKQILNALISEAKRRHAYALSLETQEETVPFYESVGFLRSGTALKLLI
jgi:predicted GNAT family N-acyltransferase